MKVRKLYLSLLILILPHPSFGQNDDFGIWYGISGGYSLGKKLGIEASVLIRTNNNASEIEQAFLEGGLSYKFNKWLSSGVAYRFTEYREDNNEFHIRHKWLADIKGSGDIGNLGLSGRFRIQRQDKTYFEDANDKIPDYYLRIKIKAEYKTPSFPVNPNIAFETFSRIFEASEKTIDKYRLSIGFDYKINKNNSVEADYMFERDYFPHLSNTHIVAITYNFKL